MSCSVFRRSAAQSSQIDQPQLYAQDTSGTVAVIATVNRILDLLESRGLLMEPLEMPTDNRAIMQLDE